MKFVDVGDDGPEGKIIDPAWEFDSVSVVMELDRGPTEWLRDDAPDEGIVGARGGCCRIRLRPDTPRPCSCSVMIGDLAADFS